MSDNSPKMTLEERIVQTLKDDSLMKLVGDEDAITELVKRAISRSALRGASAGSIRRTLSSFPSRGMWPSAMRNKWRR